MVMKPTIALALLPLAAFASTTPLEAREKVKPLSIAQFSIAPLVIRPDGSAFVIGDEETIPSVQNETREGVVRLGTGLSFDAVMFARDGLAIPEATHAPNR